jgi:16S rRNA G966 N2-methylase RsmD
VDNIVSTDLTQYGTDFNAVYMDPPFLLPGEEPVAGKITIDDFVSDCKDKTRFID